MTYTLNGSFGAGVVRRGTGILLNNEMDDFTAKPGVPNLYGLVQGEANAIAAEEDAALLDEPDHRRQGRQALHGDRQPRRRAHHHHHAGSDHQRHRLRHEHPGGDRRAAHPPSVAAGQGLYRAVRAVARYDADSWPAWATTFSIDKNWPIWGQAAGILVGGKSLGEIAKGGGARYNGAMDARAQSGTAAGY